MTQHIFHCCRGEHTRPALIIRCHIELSTKTARRSLKGPGNGKLKQMVRKFPTFRSERKKRTTSGGSPQFPNGFFGKLPFHLTLNRNFRIFWLNGSRPLSAPDVDQNFRNEFPEIFCSIRFCTRISGNFGPMDRARMPPRLWLDH